MMEGLASRFALLLVVGVLIASGCTESDPFNPASSIEYQVDVFVRATTITHGIQVGFRIEIRRSAEATVARVRVRARCAENVAVLSGSDLVATLPSPATCPDSVYTVKLTSYDNRDTRFFYWTVPEELPPGSYTVRALTLVSPSLEAETTMEVE